MASIAYRRTPMAFVRYTGPTTISGVVRQLTTPVSRPVYLLEQDGFRVLRETRSGSNGVYSFPNMEADKQYLVMSIDPDGAYNAVVADRVQT
jgi:hypothetical protein